MNDSEFNGRADHWLAELAALRQRHSDGPLRSAVAMLNDMVTALTGMSYDPAVSALRQQHERTIAVLTAQGGERDAG